ncbi:uncharacterized protein LOC144886840 [Branchiostoma floridae x Branchiostoma japonicum]
MIDSIVLRKRSGRVSMTTMTLFTGVVVLLILLQPAAAVPPERSLLAVKEGTEKGPEEIGDTAGEAQGDAGHVREVRSFPQDPMIPAGPDDDRLVSAPILMLSCPCVRYCRRRRCRGRRTRRRCRVRRLYCCRHHCSFGTF